ncbi:BglG family transcription antiterminator [Enterococcus sp. AZ103]|uniref:BglG family transcription antiterminator n=1 Tax=Enterococcus sp. AZ103 TaxID=2774628 RepID=UPI003F219548
MMRQERIVEYLYLQDQIVTPQKIADAFGISERTLANDIKLINAIGKSAGFALKRIRGSGYQLVIVSEEKFQSFLTDSFHDELIDSTSPEQRIKSSLIVLLFSEDFITLQELADYLVVSLSTIKTDMKKVEAFCQKYQLKLYSKAHYGLKITGSEMQKRKAILDLLRKNIKLPMLTEKYQEFNRIFDEADLRNFLQQQIQLNHLKVSDIVFENVMQHIKLLSFRMLQHNTLSDEENFNSQIQDTYDQLTKNLLQYLTDHYQLSFSQSEKIYLKEQLRGKFTVLKNQTDNHHLVDKIHQALKIIDRRYQTSFSSDQELANALLMHVAPLLQRLYTGHQLENPLIEDIYTQYANVFSLALTFIDLLNEGSDVKISKDEIGYVAIYFAASLEKYANQVVDDYQKIAVICATGGGASYLLKVNLERLFAKAEVTTFALNEISRIGNQYDLLISTVPLETDQIDLPVIFTKPILNAKDLSKIEKDLTILRESQKHGRDANQIVLDLFKEEWFRISYENSDYLTLLQNEAVKLEKFEVAKPGFAKSVLERENLIDTIYQKGIAGPHPMEQGAIKEIINLILLKNPLNYHDKEVKIIFLINIKKDHLTLHKEISHLMIQMMDDPELNNQLAKINSYNEFITYIKSLMKEG